MRIIGQFNLGFMIAEIDGDLFILDQHACDEKYRYSKFYCQPLLAFIYICVRFRFETLQHSTVIHQQPLLVPLPIDTTAAEEMVISDNIAVFEQNGFKLDVDLERAPGQRVRLCAVPFSKTVQFGKEDVLELASMLDASITESVYVSKLLLKNDFPDKTMETVIQETELFASKGSIGKCSVRLPKLLTMFASRACRSAVMIGTALTEKEMKGIVNRLAGIEQPWNCPHGRPTMRHLIDLETHKKMS
jgi:DNA mismatch repair protein PMS2